MDRSTTDAAVDQHGPSDLVLADLPSTSGAHWANRDQDILYRRSATQPAPFRRPPAVNSFPGADGDGSWSPSAYVPPDTAGMPDTAGTPQSPGAPDGGWFGGRDGEGNGTAETDPYGQADTGEWQAVEQLEPEYGPAPPATPGRISFGVTAGPISPSGRAAAAPMSPAHGYSAPEPQLGLFGTGGHEIRPHRASRRDVAAQEQSQQGQPRATSHGEEPRRSRTVMIATIALGVLVLLGGAASGVMFFSGSGNGESAGKTISAPLDGRTTASFELIAATTRATVRTQDLGTDLYKITTVDATVPSAVLSDDRVQLNLTGDGADTGGQVQVLLSTKVRWALRFVGGADEQIVDLGSGRVSRLDVLGSSRRFQLALPKPTGTVPISVSGSIGDLSIASPPRSPVRVQVDGGAQTIVAGKLTLRDVRPGSTVTPTGWNVANRYDVDVAAKLTLLSVKTG